MEYYNLELYTNLKKRIESFRASNIIPESLSIKVEEYFEKVDAILKQKKDEVKKRDTMFQNLYVESWSVLLYMGVYLDLPEINDYVVIDNETSEVIYNYFYFLRIYVISQNNGIFVNSIKDVLQRVMDAFSVSNVISAALSEGSTAQCDIRELEFSKYLVNLDIRDASLILEHLDITKDERKEMKKFLKAKDDFSLSEKIEELDIDYSVMALCARFACIADEYKNIWHEGESKISYLQHMSKCCTTSMQHDVLSIIYRAETEKSLDGLLRVRWDYYYDSIIKTIESFVLTMSMLSRCSTDLKSVMELRKLIGESELLSAFDIYTGYDASVIGERLRRQTTITYSNQYADQFKELYINTLQLPEGGKRKEKGSFFEGRIDKKQAIHIYDVLVSHGLMQRNADVFYSFVYRFTSDYAADKEPEPIRWLGEKRDLYYLIYLYFSGYSKIWSKTAAFFTDSQGNKLNTNGVANQAKTPSVLMEEIVEQLKK